jgi:hypothetical protein
MSERCMSTMLVALAVLLPSCGGDGDSENGGGSGGSTLDAAVPDTGDEAAEGPWECLEDNVARRKSDGDTGGCGLLRCTVEDGCGNSLGCDAEEDCISSTAEAGWDVDLEVSCVGGQCEVPPSMPDQ